MCHYELYTIDNGFSCIGKRIVVYIYNNEKIYDKDSRVSVYKEEDDDSL